MKNSRILQNQPLPSVYSSEHSFLTKQKFFFDYPGKKAVIERTLAFSLVIENIGNGPTVAIEVFPELTFYNEKNEPFKLGSGSIKYALIKAGEKKELRGSFVNDINTSNNLSEGVMNPSLWDEPRCYGNAPLFPVIKLTIYYRNLLGATFREIAYLDVAIAEDEQHKIKDCLKAEKAKSIEHQEDLKRLTNLLKLDSDKASAAMEELNSKLKDATGCGELKLTLQPDYDYFNIQLCSEKDYKKTTKAYAKIDVRMKAIMSERVQT